MEAISLLQNDLSLRQFFLGPTVVDIGRRE
jgi:hypothetical protein